MKNHTGIRVRTNLKVGRGLQPGECKCTNGEKWCMDARGGIRNMGSCGDEGTGTGGGGVMLPNRP